MEHFENKRSRTLPDLIPPHGGYRDLKSYQMAEIVHDATLIFCDRFIDKRSRTHDQISQQAKKHLAGLVLSKSVRIEEYGEDRYGRTLAIVYLDENNVNLEMVKAGFAEVYWGTHAPGFDPAPYLQA